MFKLFKKNNNDVDISSVQLPKHVGIIMDGNGRWAKKRGLPRTAGHTVGAKKCKEIIKYCNKIGLKHLTLYAFSTENWKRPKDEVDKLMDLFKEYLLEIIRDADTDTMKMNFIGGLDLLNDEIKNLIAETHEIAKTKTGTLVNIAINYGGRDEIVRATKNILNDIKNSTIDIDDINEDLLSKNMYTTTQPDPDIIIRTGGEHRISNFLIWQSAYAEYFILDTMWPNFSTKDLDSVLFEFSKRNRRRGGI